MRPRRPTVSQDVLVRAASLYESIREDGQLAGIEMAARQFALVIDDLGELREIQCVGNSLRAGASRIHSANSRRVCDCVFLACFVEPHVILVGGLPGPLGVGDLLVLAEEVIDLLVVLNALRTARPPRVLMDFDDQGTTEVATVEDMRAPESAPA